MLTEVEAAKALRYIGKIESAHRPKAIALEILIWTGMRKSELVGLLRSDIDLIKKKIYVTKGRPYVKRYGTVQRKTTKNKEPRSVPINEELLPKLENYLEWYDQEKPRHSKWETDGLIVCIRKYTHITACTINDWVKDLIDAVKIEKKISPHKLRHSAASIMLSNKADSLSVADSLGHDVATLKKYYAHAFDNKKEQAMAEYGRAIRNAMDTIED